METWKPNTTVTWMVNAIGSDGYPAVSDLRWYIMDGDTLEILITGKLTYCHHYGELWEGWEGRVFLDEKTFVPGKTYIRRTFDALGNIAGLSTAFLIHQPISQEGALTPHAPAKKAESNPSRPRPPTLPRAKKRVVTTGPHTGWGIRVGVPLGCYDKKEIKQ